MWTTSFSFFLLTSIFSTSNQKSFLWRRRTKKRPISAVFFYLPLISGPARLLDVDWWVSESPVKEMEANFKVKSAHSQSQSVSKADSQLSLLLIFFFFFLQCVCRAQMLSQYTAIFSLSKDLELSLVVKMVISRDISVTLQCLVYFPPTRLPGDKQWTVSAIRISSTHTLTFLTLGREQQILQLLKLLLLA